MSLLHAGGPSVPVVGRVGEGCCSGREEAGKFPVNAFSNDTLLPPCPPACVQAMRWRALAL